MKPSTKWTKAQQADAATLGWGIFAVDGDRRRLVIQKDDEADLFRSDAEAVAYVLSQTHQPGDNVCKDALEVVTLIVIRRGTDAEYPFDAWEVHGQTRTCVNSYDTLASVYVDFPDAIDLTPLDDSPAMQIAIKTVEGGKKVTVELSQVGRVIPAEDVIDFNDKPCQLSSARPMQIILKTMLEDGVIAGGLSQIGRVYPPDDVIYFDGKPCRLSSAKAVIEASTGGAGAED